MYYCTNIIKGNASTSATRVLKESERYRHADGWTQLWDLLMET